MAGKHSYRVTGQPFDGKETACSEKQVAAVNALLAIFWGDDRSACIEIRIKHRGEPGSGSRCTAIYPICMERVHNPDDCGCTGFEDERGGNKIVITRGRPLGAKRRQSVSELNQHEQGE